LTNHTGRRRIHRSRPLPETTSYHPAGQIRSLQARIPCKQKPLQPNSVRVGRSRTKSTLGARLTEASHTSRSQPTPACAGSSTAVLLPRTRPRETMMERFPDRR
jgi:hypothetical protein